jgi:hypothetical protein
MFVVVVVVVVDDVDDVFDDVNVVKEAVNKLVSTTLIEETTTHRND